MASVSPIGTFKQYTTSLLSTKITLLSTVPTPLKYTVTLYVPDGWGDLPIPFIPGSYGNNGDILVREYSLTVTLLM